MDKHTHLKKDIVVAIFLTMCENKINFPLQLVCKTQTQNMNCNNE
jgi:hypothetical protein